ncbi:MAG TPA: hypothetical protein VN256_27325 [Pyrinomonadaceae bacterium]|nr:hypothetical protein [Pyrinomonadaceae bacterium]
MDKDKVENAHSIFTSEGEVKEIKAGSMSMVIGSAKLSDKFGEQEVEEYEYPEIPEGASSEYDTWLG